MKMDKLTFTMKVFDEYEERFTRKRLLHRPRYAFNESEKQEIIKNAKETIRFDESLVPEIKIHDEQEQLMGSIRIKHLLFESWKDFYGISTLFIPDESVPRPAPLVLICPGHGKEGRLTASYQQMPYRLAKQGSYVLLLENIGQGCRRDFGHFDVPEVFYCGLTPQGLIVAETCAWVRYMKKQKYIDSAKIGAAGNSGGGTITHFLCATEPALCAIASCGYPSEYEYVFQKERRHCDCNILPGVIGKLEMWEVYSAFAPKPLLLNMGENDNYFPVEHFNRNARKVGYIYSKMNKAENFRYAVTNTTHSWHEQDIKAIEHFFGDIFGLQVYENARENVFINKDEIILKIPEKAITTAQLAQRISGIVSPKDIVLSDIFKPTFNGKIIKKDEIITDLGRGDVMRVLAQFEAVLK